MSIHETVEGRRLAEARSGAQGWKVWGPYLSDRQWGTVREDYSTYGTAWEYFTHDDARSRVYRWGEDGIGGYSDDQQRLCFALALWNGRDPILKERYFGLTGNQGNHGEDVKEYYFYLDATPTASYLKMLYKYPQAAFPYADLCDTNARRSREEPEYELIDTGVFAEDRYFDVAIEYAKAGPDDTLIRISATNHGPDEAELHLLPSLWFRNTWIWGGSHDTHPKPLLRRQTGGDGQVVVRAEHPELGPTTLTCEGAPALLFTENETNAQRLFNAPNYAPFVKDGINDAVVHGLADRVNMAQQGTKAAAHYRLSVAPGATETIRLRLTGDATMPPPVNPADDPRENGHVRNRPARNAHHEDDDEFEDEVFGGEGAWGVWDDERAFRGRSVPPEEAFRDCDAVFAQRIAEADAFYAAVHPAALTADERLVQRQAFAGLIWSKQLFYFDVREWLDGDPGQPPPPPERRQGRNREWPHFNAMDIMSMPDAWEYPWFAAWDLAFHCIPLALIDPDFAKDQLLLLGREWFQHPNGQVPAYEWAFGDVNPPVVAWAAWRVYKIDQKRSGQSDLDFLERVFHKQLLNFTWWVNRKDSEGNNVFEGGFLGLDNIGVFDRSRPLPTGGHLEQSDGTSWMGMFCLNMLTIALELATRNRVYEDVATKFFEHFLYIANAMNTLGANGVSLWDDEDEFFCDVLHQSDGQAMPMKIRSMVGVIPLFAVTTIEPDLLARLPDFRARLEWFLEHRPDLASLVSRWQEPGLGERRLLAIARGHRMKRVLRRMLDEAELLSPYGVRALSRFHLERPYVLDADGARYMVQYQPGESNSGLFGGNSNWRGPIWFPVNYLIIESLQQFHHYYGDDFKVEYPTGSGQLLTLDEIATALAGRLASIFLRDAQGRRAVFGDVPTFQADARWSDCIPFYEYFHGDNGRGVGASHQTGWTALVAKLLDTAGRHREPASGRQPDPLTTANVT
ncbi:MAG: glucosidase [Chloroflexi bacterium]|nr:glucosidase [Chloroflexota bacterium]